MTLPGDVGLDAAALMVLLGAGHLARREHIGHREERAFRLLNGGIGVAERPVWAVMQFGNGLAAAAAPVVLRLAGHPWRSTWHVALAGGGGWHLAKVAKAIVLRERPAALLDDVVLRDGNPTGRGFVSGHATVAMSVALAAAPLVPAPVGAGLVTAAVLVALARVHVGAHLPLDVVGGVALACIWGPACGSFAPGRDGRR